MTPPEDSESVGTDDAALETASTEAAQSSAQSNEASVVSETPEMSPAESEEEVDEMVETLEDLILEAYNNMQIDGEYIFLPDEVAEKLHRVVEQMKIQEIGEEEQTENKTSAGEDSTGDGPVRTDAEEVKVPQQETPTDRPEPEQEQEQEQKEQVQEREATEVEKSVQKQPPALVEDEEVRLRKVEALQVEVAELREEEQKRRIPRVASSENLFTASLAPVPEVDESASSGPPSPSPPHSRSHSGMNTPKLRAQTPGKGSFPPPPLVSLSSTPSNVAASPDHSRKTPASKTPDQSDGTKHKSKVLTYEKRREAALKLKQDKMKRELRIRESARKQREDAKRQLEEVHQKEMEEKRERVRRIREERLHRRTGKPGGAKGTKKDG